MYLGKGWTTMSTIRTVAMPGGLGRLVLRVAALLLIAFGLLLPPVAGALAQDAAGAVEVVRMDGTITPVMARYLDRAIRRAEERNAAAVVLVMDTPGGLSSAMDDMIRDILESEVPVVVYVGPRGARAASAGVYLTYAAHIAAMAPGTNIGSASPVFIGGDGATGGDETMARKVTNDAVAQIKNLAELRGRNAVWAEAAVREAVNATATEALDLDVIDLIAEDVPALLAAIDGQRVTLASGETVLRTAQAETRDVKMTFVEEFLQILADPTVAYILLSIGSLGLFLELSNPGAVLPGVVGGLCLLLGLFALGTLPVNWAGLLLIGFAFVLFIADLFVPSFGTLTIGGLISFVLGSYLLIDSDVPGYTIAEPVIWTVTACLLAFFVFIAGAVLRARLRRPATGRQALIGAVGTVRRELKPDGMVFLHGELWRATAEEDVASAVPAGAQVVVAGLAGLRLVVRPAEAEVRNDIVTTADRRVVAPS
jgi:membrane-bound serine protease (ClpP class)